MNCWKVTGAVVAITVVGAAGYVISGSYNVAADEPHWGATTAVVAMIRDRSVAVRAAGIDVPTDLDKPARVRQGAVAYAEMCAGCHLSPGIVQTELRKGLYPAPPDLVNKPVQDTRRAFWTIRHGIKMTAMPAWGQSHSDAQIWNIVAFLRELDDMPPERYRTLTAGANPAGHGHEGSHGH